MCLGLNVALLAALLARFATGSSYFRVGPHPDFVLVGVVVDTRARYAALLAVVTALNVVISELGEPVLIFNVYNPDKTVITDFSRTRLLWYANVFFFVSNARRIFEVVVTVTQIDIALASVVIEQLASMATVCLLVSEKRFDPEGVLV